MFLPGLLPHPDAVGVGVTGRGPGRHGAVTSGVVGYRAGIGQVSWREGLTFDQIQRVKCPEIRLDVCNIVTDWLHVFIFLFFQG